MVAAVLLGLVIGAALGALGGGGSILAVPVLVYIAGQDPKAATATSLVAVVAAAAVGAITHARAGNVRWRPALAFIATGVAGSWLGSKINKSIDGDLLLLAFSVLVVIAAYRMLTACPTCTRVGEEQALSEVDDASDNILVASLPEPGTVARAASARSVVRVVLAGSVVGFLTGLFGVGGGFVIVPALTLALGLSMPEAIATSLVVIVGNGLVALWFRGVDAVEWSVAGPFTVTMLIGSFAGSLIAHRLPAKRSLTAFASLLVAVALATGISATVGLVS